jgi:cyanophycin synthetase
MGDWLTHPLALRGLYAGALLRAFLRHKNPRRRQAKDALTRFHEQMWRDAALELGATFKVLERSVWEIELDGARTRVFERLAEIDNPVTLEIAGNKPLTYQLLRDAGLPIPKFAAFSYKSPRAALEFLQEARGECVVKPASGTGGGRGVTTGIRTRWQLVNAAAAASVYGDDLLIEAHMEGDNYRLLYLDGELIDAFIRRPPTLIADGRTTLAEQIRAINVRRLAQGAELSQVQLTIDMDLHRTLARQGHTLRSIPPEGTMVKIKTVINENAAADNEAAMHLLCKEIVEAGRAAAGALRVRLAGVDVISRDPSRPLSETGGAILEVNTTPNYYYHYRKQGGCCPVALHVLRRLLAEQSTTSVDARSIAPAGVV